MILNPVRKPVWLARPTGLAHAFMSPSRNEENLEERSCCGCVDRSFGVPFEPAPDKLSHCRQCVDRLRERNKRPA